MACTSCRLPFIPTLGQNVNWQLPQMPQGWNEDGWEIDWDEEKPSVFIDRNSNIDVWVDINISHMTANAVAGDLQNAGWDTNVR